MRKQSLSTAAALSAIFSLAVLAQVGAAQAQQAAQPAPIAKPSPYQGISAPPADDAIITDSDDSARQAPAVVQRPVPAPTPVSAPADASPAVPSVTAEPSDSDDGIIETPLPPSGAASPEVQLRSRNQQDPDAGIVTYVPGPANALPEGTVFNVRMAKDIYADEAIPGTPFTAQLTQNLMHNGVVAIPVGSELRGRVIYATSGRRISGRSVIHLRADEFVLPDGAIYHLHAQVIDTQGSDTKASGEGDIIPKEHGKRTFTELAAASGGGALIGAGFGGGVGAAVGSAIGAGVVTTHWLFADRVAYVPAQSMVIFSLTDPLILTPVHE